MPQAENPSGNIAIVNYDRGCALICKDGKHIAVLQIKEGVVRGPNPIPERLHIGMWLQPAGAVEEPAGEPPYDELKARMIGHQTLVYMHLFYTDAVDGKMPMDIRSSAAQALEEKLQQASEALVNRFQEIVMLDEFQLSASTRDAPFTGKSAEILAKAIEKWGHRPLDRP